MVSDFRQPPSEQFGVLLCCTVPQKTFKWSPVPSLFYMAWLRDRYELLWTSSTLPCCDYHSFSYVLIPAESIPSSTYSLKTFTAIFNPVAYPANKLENFPLTKASLFFSSFLPPFGRVINDWKSRDDRSSSFISYGCKSSWSRVWEPRLGQSMAPSPDVPSPP